ncbi:hypothetical protein AB0F30_16790 [Streptomyces sp. NPDC029006]|uniref:hypothetical protein n=1 Tax=Streptomyces sp. NPDC029006 TaxID=3155467 RepID=UPI0033EC28DF
MTNQPTADPRARKLAQHHHRIAEEGTPSPRPWNDLLPTEQNRLLWEASNWLRAAVEAGIAPPIDRPTPKHSAVWLDDEGFLYGEYQTVPSSDGDAILRLVWASEECSSKQELEDQGVEFRLIGWSE